MSSAKATGTGTLVNAFLATCGSKLSLCSLLWDWRSNKCSHYYSHLSDDDFQLGWTHSWCLLRRRLPCFGLFDRPFHNWARSNIVTLFSSSSSFWLHRRKNVRDYSGICSKSSECNVSGQSMRKFQTQRTRTDCSSWSFSHHEAKRKICYAKSVR